MCVGSVGLSVHLDLHSSVEAANRRMNESSHDSVQDERHNLRERMKGTLVTNTSHHIGRQRVARVGFTGGLWKTHLQGEIGHQTSDPKSH